MTASHAGCEDEGTQRLSLSAAKNQEDARAGDARTACHGSQASSEHVEHRASA